VFAGSFGCLLCLRAASAAFLFAGSFGCLFSGRCKRLK